MRKAVFFVCECPCVRFVYDLNRHNYTWTKTGYPVLHVSEFLLSAAAFIFSAVHRRGHDVAASERCLCKELGGWNRAATFGR